MPTVGSLAWQLIANSLGFSTGTKAAVKDTRALRTELLTMRGVAGGLTTVMGGLGVAIGGAAIIGGFRQMISESSEAIDQMGSLSDRLGVATEKLTGLGHAAQLNGSSAESLNDALDTISKTVGTLNERGGRNVEVLHGMGVDIAKLSQLSPDEMFLELADAMESLGTAQERAALAGMLKLGPDMINVLSKGRDALEDNVREAEALGIAYSRVDAEKIKQANDAWAQAMASVKGLSNEITLSLAPAVEVYAAALHDVVNVGKVIRGEQDLGDLFKRNLDKDLVKLPNEEERFKLLQKGVKSGLYTPDQALAAGLPKEMLPKGAMTGDMNQEARDAAQEKLNDKILAMHLDREKKRQEELDRLRKEDEAARKKEIDARNELFESLKTPSEKFRDELSKLGTMFGAPGSELFETNRVAAVRAFEDLQDRIRGQIGGGGPVGTQSTAAIRAGSIEALRAQHSGNIVAKQLKEAEKQTREQEAMRGLLETISDKIQGFAEAPG